MNADRLKARAQAVIEQAQEIRRRSRDESYGLDSERLAVVTGALGLLEAAYGPASPRYRGVAEGVQSFTSRHYASSAVDLAVGATQTLIAELDAGLVGNLRLELTGAVLSDFLALSREHLDNGELSVAAVLAAAAFEDTIRRMGQELAGIQDRLKLDQVLQQLKKQGAIADSQFAIAQSYLSFRNNALHADWGKLAAESVASVLGFVEVLILRHFSGD